MRRAAQLARSYSHLKVQDIRGNLNTRLAKLDGENSIFAGIVLAKAGLIRMGWQKRISQTLEPDDLLYAVGQGALAVECRSNDTTILQMLRKLHCVQTQCKILTERSFLKTLGGGCSAPVAVKTQITQLSTENFQINITGAVWSLDGKIQIQGSTQCVVEIVGASTEQEQTFDDDIVPAKRRKIASDIGENSPPKIINDTEAVPDKLDVSAFITIHGDLFKKCPHLVQQQRLNAASNESESEPPTKVDAEKCPVHSLPVGQDVMGECPYFETSEKVLAAVASTSVAAINALGTSKSVAKVPTALDGAGDGPAGQGGAGDGKCPFLAGSSEQKSKCPIVSKVDAESKQENHNENIVPLETPTVTELLYCGLYRHKCIPLNIYEKCETLGKKLAIDLIDNGALKVMEAAQLEIRKKI